LDGPVVVGLVDPLALVNTALVRPLVDPALRSVEYSIISARADGPEVAVGILGLRSTPDTEAFCIQFRQSRRERSAMADNVPAI
jgi:hypothetical protein